MDSFKWTLALVPVIAISAGLAAGGDFSSSLAPSIAAHVEHDITFLSGGVGDDETTAIEAERGAYNLRLTFAAAETGAYLADVRVTIESADHETLVDTMAEGPIFLAHLPPGRYRIVASSGGVEQVRYLEIGDERQNRFVLYWKQTSVPVVHAANEERT